MNSILTLSAGIVGVMLFAFGNDWGLLGLVPVLVSLIQSDSWEFTK